jgi:hypothetical protein
MSGTDGKFLPVLKTQRWRSGVESGRWQKNLPVVDAIEPVFSASL